MKFRIIDDKGQEVKLNRRSAPVSTPRRLKKDQEPDVGCDDASCNDAAKELTEEELKTLRKLLGKADDLLALLKGDEKDDKEDKGEKKGKGKEEEEEIDFEEEEFKPAKGADADEDLLEIPEEETEEVEEEEFSAHDSKKSFGSIEKKQNVADSVDGEEEIAQAWAKYYGGK